jgi:predicted nucleic acid-binding protein
MKETNSLVLLDTNIVLDLALYRSRSLQIEKIISNPENIFCVSTSTFLTCFYILRKDQFTKEEIFGILSQFKILTITEKDCIYGFSMARNSQDVEDCSEIALAIRKNCKCFVTADFELFNNYNHRLDIKLID